MIVIVIGLTMILIDYGNILGRRREGERLNSRVTHVWCFRICPGRAEEVAFAPL